MIDLEHLMLYDGKPWKFSDFNEPLVIDLQGLEYKQGGVSVIVKGKPDGHADITIAPIDKRDEIGLAIYADVHVEDGKLPENYTIGLDINIDDKYYMHPGTNLEINQDKWIVSSKGVWIAEPVTINAVYISEETTTTWLIDGWRNTVTQPEQKTEKKEMEHTHTQTETYDLSQPICENPKLALEALKQIIQANKDGTNEAVIFMTVKRCQKCGEWPTCRLDSDGQHVTITIECSQDSSHARYIPTMDDTVKDIIRMWNHINSNPFMEDRETRNKKSETEIACTQQQIDSYSMVAPISQDVNCALAVLKQIIQENMQDSCIATMPIRRCPQCNALPTCRLDDKSTAIIMECVKGGHQHSYYCSRSNDSLTKIIIEWNKAQNIVRNLKSVKDKKFDDYDWDAPIGENIDAATAVLMDHVARVWASWGDPKRPIRLCRECGAMPTVFTDEDDDEILYFGCGHEGHRRVYICATDTLNGILKEWNEEQKLDKEDKKPTELQEHKETEMATTGEMIEKYDWDAPIGENMELAAKVLEDCLEQQKKSGGHPKKNIYACHICGYSPHVSHNEDTVSLGCSDPRHASFVLRDTCSLSEAVTHWNAIQEAGQMRHSCDIVNDINTYIQKHSEFRICKRSFGLGYISGYSCTLCQPVDDDIILCATCGRPPFASYFGEKIILGCQSPDEKDNFVSIYKDADETAHDLIMKWNALQMFIIASKHNIFHGPVVHKILMEHGYRCVQPVATSDIDNNHDASVLGTRLEKGASSLDVMGRNALTLPQQAKTIEELEAEADRGLSKPEDVQKLKEANVLNGSQKAIAEVCDEIKELLLEKNRKYGDSALNPCRIFARSDRLEQIRVRIDDKLNRIKNEQGDEDEDVVKDLIGYLVLYEIAKRMDDND